MIKTVFLDLDDTLLRTDTDTFVRQYLIGLTELLMQRYPALRQGTMPIGKAIQQATRLTLENLDPMHTNAEIFNAVMQELIDIPPEDLRTVYEEYLGTGYLNLRSITAPMDGAPALIGHLAEQGLGAVIATNPLFPLDAIQQRLAWAGLESPGVPFAFISNIDESHFTKPNPHYYEELLTRIGVEADEAIMVGDDLKNDMLPAAQAGMNTFWIGDTLPADFPPEFVPDGNGTLDSFDSLVRAGWLSTLKPRPRTPEQLIPRMLGNVAALHGLVNTIRPEQWEFRPDPNEWAPLEVVVHLRDSERHVQRPRLQRIAREYNPFISETPAPPGPGERDLTGETGRVALAQFWDERCMTLNFIYGLQADDWQRPARHSIFGPTTLLEMAHFTARHDLLHISQLCETLE